MNIGSKISQSIKVLSLTAALGLGFTLPALALDGDAFFSTIQSKMKENGYNIEANKVDVNGNNVTISEAKITPDDSSDVKEIVIKDLTFDNVEEPKTGGYSVDRIAFNQAEVENGHANGRNATISNAEAKKVFILAKGAKETVNDPLPYELLAFKNISFSDKGKTVISFDDFSFGFTEYSKDEQFKMAGELGNAQIDVATLDGPAKENLTKMGYSQLQLQGNFDLNANLSDGHVDLNFHGNMNDAGQLDLAIGLTGLTKDLAQELMRVSEQANSPLPKERQIAGVAALGLIQQLSLNSIDIKFDDNSITNKVIDLQKGADVKREDFVAQLKMILPLGLGQLQHPEFAAKVSDQLGKYLDNPENLEVTAKPENGAPFAVIAATAMTSPKALIDLLKVDIKANQ